MRTDGVHALCVDVTHGNCWITFVQVLKKQHSLRSVEKQKEGICWIRTRSWIHQTKCFSHIFRRKPKFTLSAPSGSKISPSLFVKFRHHKDVRTICYWMIISGSKKRFFNSILPVLKLISLREIIAFFHSFVSVRYLTIFILFCFALFFHFPLRVNWFFFWRREGGGLGVAIYPYNLCQRFC